MSLASLTTHHVISAKFSNRPCIHSVSITIYLLHTRKGLEPIPACSGREAGCSLDGLPVCHTANTYKETNTVTFTPLEFPEQLTCMAARRCNRSTWRKHRHEEKHHRKAPGLSRSHYAGQTNVVRTKRHFPLKFNEAKGQSLSRWKHFQWNRTTLHTSYFTLGSCLHLAWTCILGNPVPSGHMWMHTTRTEDALRSNRSDLILRWFRLHMATFF